MPTRRPADRFGKGGEVLFAKICRQNGITHRPTAPASPNQNGKVERFHGTLRPEFLDVAGPFTSIEAAQTELDAWVAGCNTDRPHQAHAVHLTVSLDRPAMGRTRTPVWT